MQASRTYVTAKKHIAVARSWLQGSQALPVIDRTYNELSGNRHRKLADPLMRSGADETNRVRGSVDLEVELLLVIMKASRLPDHAYGYCLLAILEMDT